MDNDRINIIQKPEVRVIRNGPISIRGYFSFRDSKGKIEEKEQELFLCRCGNSENKPFCDGTHNKQGVRN